MHHTIARIVSVLHMAVPLQYARCEAEPVARFYRTASLPAPRSVIITDQARSALPSRLPWQPWPNGVLRYKCPQRWRCCVAFLVFPGLCSCAPSTIGGIEARRTVTRVPCSRTQLADAWRTSWVGGTISDWQLDCPASYRALTKKLRQNVPRQPERHRRHEQHNCELPSAVGHRRLPPYATVG